MVAAAARPAGADDDEGAGPSLGTSTAATAGGGPLSGSDIDANDGELPNELYYVGWGGGRLRYVGDCDKTTSYFFQSSDDTGNERRTDGVGRAWGHEGGRVVKIKYRATKDAHRKAQESAPPDLSTLHTLLLRGAN